MREIIGTYANAKVFTDDVDEYSIEQIRTLCCQPFVIGAKIRLMPDVHAGAGCTIGTTMTISDKICPNLVGVDIGCGMETLIIRANSPASRHFDPACPRDFQSVRHRTNLRMKWSGKKFAENIIKIGRF